MGLTMFPFTLRSPDGQQYRITVPAPTESDAERILKSVLDSLQYRDRIVSRPERKASERTLPLGRPAARRNYHLLNWADKSVIYKNKDHRTW